ncbi:MAG: hypothetical protein LUC93_03630 [Planctomycetaceae bacterium]|nr:hypothetical protein [Planctomycetaceae bacterium]
MRGKYQCRSCGQELHSSEFYTLWPRSGRRECRLCFHTRMERLHRTSANKVRAERQRDRDRAYGMAAEARAVAGRD